ncbi:hypothetical protein [Marinibacterium profundimaris]|uniref:Lipoprotein n=1 Tax=Marinibacterium profundimaris TaxID=1679460 RepID=A0A225NEN6_9RHOB|nr:hypothetical protein [Marinibacterium profundimaris]OWU70545.1 hypothetical protein ATO3_19985 [Marinibacterium profundimaris]
MTFSRIIVPLAIVTGLTACVGEDKSYDGFIDRKSLSTLEAGIWVDPNGCDHWIIDDGLEGYLSQRLDKYGKPVCSGIAPPNTATGNFKGGSGVPDLL